MCTALPPQYRRVPVSVPSLGREPLHTAVVGPSADELEASGHGPSDPVLVLLHSFDSSSLEWRRTYPRLQEACGLPVVAIDLVGVRGAL
jgi:pimeloyl-ACP methyl ester carboxylesterase